MNLEYLESAKDKLNNIPLLVNVVSRRVKQLNSGQRPLVKADNIRMSKLDLALKEVAEGTLTAEMNFQDSKPSMGDNLITL